jgi:hypothetical protein
VRAAIATLLHIDRRQEYRRFRLPSKPATRSSEAQVSGVLAHLLVAHLGSAMAPRMPSLGMVWVSEKRSIISQESTARSAHRRAGLQLAMSNWQLDREPEAVDG